MSGYRNTNERGEGGQFVHDFTEHTLLAEAQRRVEDYPRLERELEEAQTGRRVYKALLDAATEERDAMMARIGELEAALEEARQELATEKEAHRLTADEYKRQIARAEEARQERACEWCSPR